jgi:hypothetical protein
VVQAKLSRWDGRKLRAGRGGGMSESDRGVKDNPGGEPPISDSIEYLILIRNIKYRLTIKLII